MMDTLPPATIVVLLDMLDAGSDSALETLDAPPASPAALTAAVRALAGDLRGRDVARGDRVAIVSPNSGSMVTAFLGAGENRDRSRRGDARANPAALNQHCAASLGSTLNTIRI